MSLVYTYTCDGCSKTEAHPSSMPGLLPKGWSSAQCHLRAELAMEIVEVHACSATCRQKMLAQLPERMLQAEKTLTAHAEERRRQDAEYRLAIDALQPQPPVDDPTVPTPKKDEPN